MSFPKPSGVLLLLGAAAAGGGCALERRHEFLEHQYLVRDLDNSIASQEHLEQEYLREQAHVNRLAEEVARLIDREEALALEASDWEFMVSEAEVRLTELKDQKAAADDAAAAIVDPPSDPAVIQARIDELLGEVEALKARLPPPAPAEPPPAPPAEPQAEGGG